VVSGERRLALPAADPRGSAGLAAPAGLLVPRARSAPGALAAAHRDRTVPQDPGGGGLRLPNRLGNRGEPLDLPQPRRAGTPSIPGLPDDVPAVHGAL